MKKFISIVALSMITSLNALAEEKGHLVSVETTKIEQVSPTIWLPGNVVSRMNSPISAEQMGQLLWIEEIGTQVKKGQLIAKIDNRHLKLQLARQQAQVKQHEADVVYLTSQKKRLSTLRQKNNTAISELERVTKDLTIAEAEVTALKLLVEQTELAITKSNIEAPFDGNISERFAHIGELITVGRPLVQLVNTQDLDVQVAAPISIAPYLTTNTKVMVKWHDKLVELPIRTWSKAGNRSSRTFDVRLAAQDLNLLPGSAVTVSLPKQKVSEATLVPRDALVLREKETFVLTIDDESMARKVPVMVGQGVGNWISVIGAISSGEEVIVRGGERVQNGQKVRIGDKLLAQN